MTVSDAFHMRGGQPVVPHTAQTEPASAQRQRNDRAPTQRLG